MKLAYNIPDYNAPYPSVSDGDEDDRPTKEVYPTLELRGEAAIMFLKAHPNLKLGAEFDGPVHLCVTGMKQSESSSGHTSDYENCVTFDVYSIDDKKSDISMDDFEKAKEDEDEEEE